MFNFYPQWREKSFLERLFVCFIFVFIFFATFYLFYQQGGSDHKHFISDLPSHILWAQRIAKDPYLLLRFFEPGLHLLAIMLVHLFSVNYVIAASFILSSFYTIFFYVLFRVVKNELRFSDFFTLLICLTLVLLAPLFIPFVSKDFILGMGSPNLWHNPTYIMIQPFTLYVTYNFMHELEKKVIGRKFYVLSFLLLISCFFKPSYAEVFLPSIVLYGVFITFKNRELTKLKKIFLFIVPTVIFLLLQFLMLYSNGHIIFSFLGVIRHHTSDPLLCLLRTIAFPLMTALLLRKEMSKCLQFCWVMLVFSLLQFAFLAQSGAQFTAGNFAWGFCLALMLVFIFSAIDLLKWMQSNNFADSKFKKVILMSILILFLWHLLSGITYTHMIFSGGLYY